MELNDCIRSRQRENACILALLHKFLPHIIDRFYGTLPLPTLSFEPYRLGVLGCYRKADGLTPSHSIHINRLYACLPFPELCRTVTHELGHLWQLLYGKPGRARKGNYHNKEFQRKMAEIGIPCSNRGHSLDMQEPFVGFLKEYGLNKSKLVLLKQAIQENPRQSPFSDFATTVELFLHQEKTHG